MKGLGFVYYTGDGAPWGIMLRLVILNAIVFVVYAAAIAFGLRVGLGF